MTVLANSEVSMPFFDFKKTLKIGTKKFISFLCQLFEETAGLVYKNEFIPQVTG